MMCFPSISVLALAFCSENELVVARIIPEAVGASLLTSEPLQAKARRLILKLVDKTRQLSNYKLCCIM